MPPNSILSSARVNFRQYFALIGRLLLKVMSIKTRFGSSPVPDLTRNALGLFDLNSTFLGANIPRLAFPNLLFGRVPVLEGTPKKVFMADMDTKSRRAWSSMESFSLSHWSQTTPFGSTIFRLP